MSKNERLTKLEVEAIAENVIGWCMKNYGISEKYSTIYLDVYYCDKPKRKDFGEFDFDTGTISIMYNSANTCKKVIQTMIHEYTHSFQNKSWYYRYHKKYGYWKNPYEKQAHLAEETDWTRCYDDLFGDISINKKKNGKSNSYF